MEQVGRIALLGAGESGIGAALLARKKGIEVFVSDAGSITGEHRQVLSQNDIRFEEGVHSVVEILKADVVVKSPGIPDTASIVQRVVDEGIRVISEIEFAGWYTKGKVLGITGSNGKTTTTLLLHSVLEAAGLDVGLAGNVGTSLAGKIAESDHEYFVVELSSFQLDGMTDFRCHVAILLNITPDHLDRYNNDMQKYIDAKFRIVQNMTEEDYFIYNADDEAISKELEKREIKAKKIPVSMTQKVEEGGYIENETLTININNQHLIMSIYELGLQGRHNAFNSMAAAIAAQVLNIRKETIRDSLSDFQNVEHRLESVATVHNIEFINDSKATNVNATWYAIETVDAPIVWIAGGVDKGNDYEMLADTVRQKVKAMVCLGKDNKKLMKAFDGIVPEIVEVTDMREAVAQAYRLGYKGDRVLLSPACASFDLFDDYEDRGQQFKEAVRSL